MVQKNAVPVREWLQLDNKKAQGPDRSEDKLGFDLSEDCFADEKLYVGEVSEKPTPGS